jgi:hypothetical protein
MTATTTTTTAATTTTIDEETGIALAAAAADALMGAYCPWTGPLDSWRTIIENRADVFNQSSHADWDARNWVNTGVAAYFDALGTTIPAAALAALRECLTALDTDYFLGADGALDV